MDTLFDLLVLLSPAAIGLVCIAVASVAPLLQRRRSQSRRERRSELLSSAD
jgi:hypothetical protein